MNQHFNKYLVSNMMFVSDFKDSRKHMQESYKFQQVYDIAGR